MKKLLGQTGSVCPVCLKRVPAYYLADGEDIFMEKHCPEHGHFSVLVWRGVVHFRNWWQIKKPDKPLITQTEERLGCPYDCGLCPEHRQRSCCVLLEVTQNCNLACPVCYAGSGGSRKKDPSFTEIESWLRFLWREVGAVNVQLSGGEPCLRDDLPQIIKLAKEIGFPFIQLNTNGLRLAKEPDFAQKLANAGLDAVFLQFDALDDDVYRLLRGRPLFAEKLQAMENCKQAYLGVVLVPTIKADWNKNQIGQIVRFALEHLPYVRGVHFQPMSYFGRYPQAPRDEERMVLSDLMREITRQTGGFIPKDSFTPSGCEHNACSFHGAYLLQPDGTLKVSRSKEESCCCSMAKPGEAVEKSKKFVANRWQLPKDAVLAYEEGRLKGQEDLDSFLLYGKAFRFCITAMAFQDAWNIDLNRLKSCHVHIVDQNGRRLLPFCAKNLTAIDGRQLYE